MCHQPVGSGGRVEGIITGGEERVMELRDTFIERAVCTDADSPRILAGLESRGQTGATGQIFHTKCRAARGVSNHLYETLIST